jgi:hypothetical protein
MAKSVIIFSCFYFYGFFDLYSRTVPKFIMEKLCSFELWKTTQIIHGNKKVLAGELQNNTIFFFELVLPERNDP